MGRTLERFDYRGYDVKISKEPDGITTRIFRASELVHKALQKDVTLAHHAAKAWITGAIEQRIARNPDEQPSAAEYAQALRKALARGHGRHRIMLLAHYRATGHATTAAELAAAAAYKRQAGASVQYGLLGRYMHEELGTPLEHRSDGTEIPTSALAVGADCSGPEETWRWVLRPEVVQAIERLGLA